MFVYKYIAVYETGVTYKGLTTDGAYIDLYSLIFSNLPLLLTFQISLIVDFSNNLKYIIICKDFLRDLLAIISQITKYFTCEAADKRQIYKTDN